MKYILNTNNVVVAVHTDDQDVEDLYPGMTVWQTSLMHKLGLTVVVTITVDDYDRALLAHLKKERYERGYTLRLPSPTYDNSSNARWKQDAADWKTHFTAVMLYGLDIMNKYEAGEPVPTLAEFKAALPKIIWTLETLEK